MTRAHAVHLVALSCLVVAPACTDVVRAPITIIVDTDLARAREEQGRLEALRAGVQEDRADLDAARAELERARDRLEATARGPQRDALLDEVRALEAKVCAPAAEPAMTVAVAAAVAAGVEAGVARGLAQLAPGGLAPAVAAPTASSSSSLPPAAPSGDRAADPVIEARARVRAARAAMQERGLDLADLDVAVAVVDRVESLAARGEGAAALELAADLDLRARGVVIDRPLLLRRYERLNARARGASLDDTRRQAVAASLGRASRAISAGQLEEAVRSLLEVSAALEAP